MKWGMDQTYSYSFEAQQQLEESLELLKAVLGPDLLGVYLYGSALVGGLQKYSDIDLFVVSNRPMMLQEKTALVSGLLRISGVYMKGTKPPIEMTIVQKGAINPWQYPPRCDFQYGEWLRESFEAGNIESACGGQMPDLALITTQVLLKSKALRGQGAEQLLVPVPYQDFMIAMVGDVERLLADLEHDTRNVVLTCARIWSTLETNMIRPKPAAADWVMPRLPEVYQPVVRRAKSICLGAHEECWDDIHPFIRPCVEFMVGKIKERAAQISFGGSSQRVTLSE